jgi:hypothetical protein
MKVVGLDEKRKACPFCGAKPACPDWTCKRLSSVAVEDESWQVWFKDEPETSVEFTFTPDTDPAA